MSLFTRDSAGDFGWESAGESTPEVAGIRITPDETGDAPVFPQAMSRLRAPGGPATPDM